jgi:hypothetical protein
MSFVLAGPTGSESGTLDFDWSASTSWALEVDSGSARVGGDAMRTGSAGSGHIHMGPFSLASSITLKLTIDCPANTSVSLTNMVGARVP